MKSSTAKKCLKRICQEDKKQLRRKLVWLLHQDRHPNTVTNRTGVVAELVVTSSSMLGFLSNVFKTDYKVRTFSASIRHILIKNKLMQ